MKPTRPKFLLPGLFFLALAAAVCLPALIAPSSRVIGNIEHPGLQGELFHQSDIVTNARDGRLGQAFESHRVGAPEGEDLREFTGFSLHLFFYLPFLWLRNLIARHNLLVVLALTLNGYCAYLLGYELTRQKLPALVCGVLFLLSPYALLKLEMGFTQKLVLWWIPLFLRDLLRFLDRRTRRRALLTGLAWALMLLTYAPYAWYAAWAGVLLVGLELRHRPAGARRLATRGWPALIPATVALLFLIVSLPYAGGSPDTESPAPPPPALDMAPIGSLDITHPFRFAPYPGFMPETDTLTLGLPLVGVLLALAALLRRKRYSLRFLILALFFLVIAIGPYPHANGRLLSRFPLPYAFLAGHLPWGERLGFPIRTLPFVEIALAAMAALALTRSRPPRTHQAGPAERTRLPAAIPVLLAIVAVRTLLLPELFPPRATSTALSPELQWIKSQGGTVLHLPVNIKGDNVRRYLYITTRTGTRMMNRYMNPRDGFPVPPLPNPSPREMQAYLDRLRAAGCELILVHPELVASSFQQFLASPADRELETYTTADTAAFRSACGPPVYSNATRLIAYRVPALSRSPSPMAPDTSASNTADTATTLSEAELRAYYDAHPSLFRRQRQLRAHRFFVPLASDATPVETVMAEEVARRIETRIAESSEASFALAEQLTREDPLGRRWGDIGYIARGSLPPEIDDVLFALDRIGATCVVRRGDGFHVFRLMDIRPAHDYAFEEVRIAVRDALLRERRAQAARRRDAAMVFIPGGEFWMGSTEEEIDDAYRMAQRFAGRVTTVQREWFEDELHRRVRVRPFRMDRHEVTVGEYRRFVEATGHRPLPEWVRDVAPDDALPVVGVSLYDARAYAQWAGKRLPTVEEWAWAARGPRRRRYPWGNAPPDGTRCNYADASTEFPWNDPAHDDGFPGLAPVGSYPRGATPHGLFDLAGNVREWTDSGRMGIVDRRDQHIWTLAQRHHVPAEHRTPPREMYCVRGGGWNNAADDMRACDERMLPPDTRDEALGFRCVRDADPPRQDR